MVSFLIFDCKNVIISIENKKIERRKTMVISKLDKKDKEVLTVIGTDNFSDGFREMRDSLLEIKQNKDKFLQLLEEVHFENYRKSFLNELEEVSKNLSINKLKQYKKDFYSICEFFGKNYKLTSKKNGFVENNIEYLEISDFQITKVNRTSTGQSFVDNQNGYSTKVEVDSVYFNVDIKNLKFDSEFEENIPQNILDKIYDILLNRMKSYNMYKNLIKPIESDDPVLLENIAKINNQNVFDETMRHIKYFVNDILHRSMTLQTKMISVIYDFDENRFRILDSYNTKNYKNKMFFGHIGNHERHKAQFVNALFDEVEMEIFADKLYNDFIKLAENKISKTLTSKKMMSLSEVVKKNIPVNLLSDQQILESLRSTQSLLDIAQIKDSIADEKQWARVLNIIDSYLNSIK